MANTKSKKPKVNSKKVTLESIAKQIGFIRSDMSKMESSLRGDIRKLDAKVDDHFSLTKQEFQNLRSEMNGRFEQVDKRFEQVDKRFEQVDQRFEHGEKNINSRFNQLDSKIDAVVYQVSKTVTEVQQLKRRLEGPSA